MSYRETRQLEDIKEYVEAMKRGIAGDKAALERGDYYGNEVFELQGAIKMRENVIRNLEKILNTEY